MAGHYLARFRPHIVEHKLIILQEVCTCILSVAIQLILNQMFYSHDTCITYTIYKQQYKTEIHKYTML
jgi:hypothetical protein